VKGGFMTPEQINVFVSYSQFDRQFAQRLHTELKNRSICVWLDYIDIEPGKRWDRVIQTALAQCTHMVLVHSAESFRSDNVWDEWSYFLEHNKPVIPLVLEDVELPFRLARVHYINFSSQSFDRAVNQLVNTLVPALPPTTPDSDMPRVVKPRGSANNDKPPRRTKSGGGSSPSGKAEFTNMSGNVWEWSDPAIESDIHRLQSMTEINAPLQQTGIRHLNTLADCIDKEASDSDSIIAEAVRIVEKQFVTTDPLDGRSDISPVESQRMRYEIGDQPC
jgi:hypothetical protein